VRRRLPAVVVALAAAAVYARTAGFHFVYDDVPIILENERLHAVARWPELLTHPWWPRGLYRPFTSLTLALDWLIGGGSPVPFHVFNLLVHVGASLLVLALAGTLMPPAAALAAALLFAVHPIHVEAVASVVGRAEVLATLFAVLAALLYRAHGRADLTPRRSRTALGAAVLGAMLLALASKESAFATPALLLLIDWAGAREEGVSAAVRFRRHAGLWAGTVVLAAVWLLLRARILGGLAGDYPAPGLAGTTAWQRLLIMLPLVPEYLRLFVFPARLSADYSPNFVPASPAFTARSLLGLAVLAGAVALAFWCRRRAVPVTFGIAWIGAALLVIGNVLVPSGVLVAERTLYLGSVGACLAIGWAWGRLLERRADAAWALLLVTVTAGGLRSWTRTEVWRSADTFFPAMVADAPGSFRGDWVGGMLTYLRGDSVGGERLIRRGLAIFDGNGAMWRDYAKQLEHQRRWSEAAYAFRRSFLADSNMVPEAARSVGYYVRSGDLARADSVLVEVRQRGATSSEIDIAASHLALARGDAAGALTLRRQVARAHPEDWRYWLLTGEAAVRAGGCPDLAESVAHLERLSPPAAARRTSALRDSAAAHNCTPATQ
jgi:hypothetical protein